MYLRVLDAIADHKDTLVLILNDLYTQFIEGQGMTHLLEGMFMFNTSPIGIQKTFADYGAFLFDSTTVAKGVNRSSCHFDNPGRIQESPKQFDVMTMQPCFRITCVLK